MTVFVRGIGLAAVVAATSSSCQVFASCQLSSAGYAHGEMPDVEMFVGDTIEIEVWRHFLPEWCQEERFSTGHAALHSDSAAISVSAGDYVLTIAALDVADSVRVAVWSTADGFQDHPQTFEDLREAADGLWALYHDFNVSVRPRPAGR